MRTLIHRLWVSRVTSFAAVRHWLQTKLLRTVAVGLLTYLVLQGLLSAWIHHVFEGRPEGPFLISEMFGVPEGEIEQNIQTCCPDYIPGWDGQFYYHIANDPLGLRDTPEHIDNASYRYQRIGVPALAWLAAWLSGYDWTPPWVFHQTQLLLVALGMAGLTYWLSTQGLSSWLALTWLGACGPLFVLQHGLPDAAAEGVLILTLIMLYTRRLAGYVALMTLLVLIREGYVVIAFTIWVASTMGWLRWGEHSFWRRCLGTALPGVILVAWTGYLWQQFGEGPLSAERSPGGLYGWPFAACWDSLASHWEVADSAGLGYVFLSAISVVVVSGLALRQATNPIVASFVPYLLLTACLGPIVWSAPQGHMKATGSVLVIGLFLLPMTRGFGGVLLRGVLIANLVAGIQWNLVRNVAAASWYSPHVCLVPPPPTPRPEGASVTPPLTSFRAPVEWLDARDHLAPHIDPGWWRWLHREAVPLQVRITNATGQTWYRYPQTGMHAIKVGYVMFTPEGVPIASRLDTIQDTWETGETREFPLWVRLPRPGPYVLMISMYQEGPGWYQEGPGWFQFLDPTCGQLYPIEVR